MCEYERKRKKRIEENERVKDILGLVFNDAYRTSLILL